MDWQRLGEFCEAWGRVVEGRRAISLQEGRAGRAGEWVIYLRVSVSLGLMLADKTVQARVTGEELDREEDAEAFGRRMGERMRRELEAALAAARGMTERQ